LASLTETCTRIDITVLIDAFASDMSWDIQKNNTVGGNEVLKSPNGTPGEDGTVGKEYMCLVDGMYQFTICDSIVDELGLAGNYNGTSDGNLIVSDNSFVFSEKAAPCSIPFTQLLARVFK
jgi:hypothetical protein